MEPRALYILGKHSITQLIIFDASDKYLSVHLLRKMFSFIS
jgi:hypothetical protein